MSASYLRTLSGGTLHRSLEHAEAAKIRAGDRILLRDFSELIPQGMWSITPTRGKWHLRPYSLSCGEGGNLLMVNDAGKSEGPEAVPPPFEIDLRLTGWYAIFLGVPRLDLRPRFAFPSGIDISLDGETYVHVGPEAGTRGGRIMGAEGVEVSCFWKCANLSGRRMQFRAPFGTFLSFPWGFVRALVSSIKLVKLGETQIQDYRQDTFDPGTRNTIIVNDGFSHYWSFAEPGEDLDARLPEIYGGSDVKMLMLQSPSTGVASWPSKVTSLVGEGLTKEEWGSRRLGDRRAYEYIRWAVDNGRCGMRVMAEVCRKADIEFHPSLRMNLFWLSNQGYLGKGLGKFFNGRWWFEHPEARKKGFPHIDYAQPSARRFVVDLVTELAIQYDIHGVNLDFTRWPPVADPETHDGTVLTSLIREVRTALSAVEKKKGKNIALSAMVVDGYQARYPDGRLMNLEDQRIDLEAWMRSGDLSFICVQAWNHDTYRAIAERYGVPYYITHDQESIHVEGGFRDDPQWRQAARPDEDPAPGEELEDEPHLNSTLDPTEYYELVSSHTASYQPAGFCILNNFIGWHSLGRFGHVDDLKEALRAETAWGQTVGSCITVL